MIAGSIYGIVLNDREERERLVGAFGEKPYAAPPEAPVVYIRPRTCATGGDKVRIATGGEVMVSPTVALLFARDAVDVGPGEALDCIGAACLALDVSLPQADYYRPAIAQQGRDGFLPLGAFAAPRLPAAIETRIDGASAHRWTLDRLVRDVPTLISDLSQFMTLRAGDLLIIGLPGDAPRVRGGSRLELAAEGLPGLIVDIVEDLA